jgi:hypothetical protein
MPDLPLASQIGLYLLLALFALYTPMLAFWQVAVLKGKAMENPDGSSSCSWRRGGASS